MTRDNENMVDTSTGDPGPNLEPADVIKCRECGGMVRRVNSQHLQTDRCRYVNPEGVRVNRDEKDHQLRPDHPETVEEYKEKYPDAPVVSPRERVKLAETNRDPETDARRREIMRRRWNSENMTDIVEDLARRYDIEEDTIWKDWQRRDEWIDRVFGLEDSEAVIKEVLAQKHDVRQRLMNVYNRAQDQNEQNAAIRALKAVDKSLNDSVDIHQTIADDEPSGDVRVEGEVTHTHRPAGDGLAEDTLRRLDEETGGGDEEIVDAQYEVVEEEGDDA